jgi:hypothetical protein
MITIKSAKTIAATAAGVACLILATAGSASAATLGFDDLVPNLENNTEGVIPNAYGGFDWTNFYFVDSTNYPTTGYASGTISPKNVAFIGFPQVNGFSEISSNSLFTFNSAFFTAAFNPVDLVITGFQGSNELFSQTLSLNTAAPNLFQPNWSGLDRLRFTPQNPTEGNSLYFAMDDFKATPVPTPALLPGLVGLGLGALRKRRSDHMAQSEEA